MAGRGSKPGERRGGRPLGGRNKATAEIRDLALLHAPAALAEAVRLAKRAKAEPARIAAINIILDRAYGKPAQAVAVSGSIGTFDPTKLTEDELTNLVPILARLALAGGSIGGGQGGDSEA